MTARVSMLLKSRASLTFFRACFLPGRAKELSVPRYLGLFSLCHNGRGVDLTTHLHLEPRLRMGGPVPPFLSPHTPL